MRFRITSAIVFAVAWGGWGSSALAHPTTVRRTVLLERFGERDLHVIVAIRIPGGEARSAFELLADHNHDGRFDDAEKESIRALLARRALDGLAVSTGTVALPLSGIEVKERIDPGDGPIEVMLHGTATFSFQSGTTVALATGEVGDPLDLVVLPGNQALSSSSRGKIQRGGLKTQLGNRDKIDLRFE